MHCNKEHPTDETINIIWMKVQVQMDEYTKNNASASHTNDIKDFIKIGAFTFLSLSEKWIGTLKKYGTSIMLC